MINNTLRAGACLALLCGSQSAHADGTMVVRELKDCYERPTPDPSVSAKRYASVERPCSSDTGVVAIRDDWLGAQWPVKGSASESFRVVSPAADPATQGMLRCVDALPPKGVVMYVWHAPKEKGCAERPYWYRVLTDGKVCNPQRVCKSVSELSASGQRRVAAVIRNALEKIKH